MSRKVPTLDALFAFKAIALSEQLIGSQKRIAATIVDHFNRRNGQCDPSIETIADLLQVSRRTVFRTINRLEQIGFLKRNRHGGHFNRNQYEPNWHRFCECEQIWKSRRAERSARLHAQRMSRSGCPPSHHSGDSSVTQTCPTNQLKETYLRPTVERSSQNRDRSTQRSQNQQVPGREQSKSSRAAYHAAERRWTDQLTRRYASNQLLYAEIIEALDPTLQRKATLAEQAAPGAGFQTIVRQMISMGILKLGQ
jgi:DNA-binding transcriptional regulator YhcF (GntR family)